MANDLETLIITDWIKLEVWKIGENVFLLFVNYY